MDHESVKLKCLEFSDGNLSPEDRISAAAHIESCPECRQDSGLWGAARKALRNQAVLVPADFKARVMASVREEESTIFDLWAWPKWELAAVAMAAFVVVSYFTVDRVMLAKNNSSDPIAMFDDAAGGSVETEAVIYE